MIKTGLMLILLCGLASAAEVRAFTNTRIIDGAGGPVIENGTLVIESGRILAVGTSARVKPPRGAATVNLGGKTVMPGPINAPRHLSDRQGLRSAPEFYTPQNITRHL